MIISNMKPNTVVLKEFLYDLKQKVDPKLRCNEIEIRELDKVIKIYNIQENCYIPLETLEELLWIYMNIQKNAQISSFIREMLNVFKADDGRQEVELLKIDQLTENIFALIGKKYTEISKTEDASLFNRIDMAKGKVLENEYPFDKTYVQEDFSNILNNIYAANNFIDLHGEGGNDEILYKKHCGRGRNKTKTVNIKERPFVCEYPECKRAFKRFEHLKRHNKMHTGERPYKCKFPGCMKSFSRSDNLSQHFKIHNVSVKSQSLRFKNYYETNRDVE